MILVVDDLKTFDFGDHDVVYARTIEQAWSAMTFLDLDELWLDHDLGTDEGGGDKTTRPICLWLAEQAFNGTPYPVGKIVICSMNPVGVAWIESTLSPYYQVVRNTNPPVGVSAELPSSS